MKKTAKQTLTLSVGDTIEGKIEFKGEKGDGILKHEGFVLFVPDTTIGDVVTVEVTRIGKSFGFGKVISKDAKEETQAEEEKSE